MIADSAWWSALLWRWIVGYWTAPSFLYRISIMYIPFKSNPWLTTIPINHFNAMVFWLECNATTPLWRCTDSECARHNMTAHKGRHSVCVCTFVSGILMRLLGRAAFAATLNLVLPILGYCGLCAGRLMVRKLRYIYSWGKRRLHHWLLYYQVTEQ